MNQPLNGMFATVRNRLGLVVSVSPWDPRDGSGRMHLVNIEYKDGLEPYEERLVWELEPHAVCQHANRLPDPAQDPMEPEDFEAMVRAARWTATMPYIDPDGEGPLDRLPVCSPLMGAVKVEDYQLVPLYKALAMPRIALLLADDVGLGKTIEAGLITTELVSRRRIGRILVLTPASLRDQWQEEMEEKFSLPFEVVDRETTQKLRKEVGIDANPWRVHARVIASYHYLKQPDILEMFLSASRVPEGSPKLPWDLIIIDECHNCMPSAFGKESNLCRAIRDILPLCEHRLFLSATPHNGRTRSFTGLLEMLDPVRFTCRPELGDAEKKRVKQVMVRRLKRHIDDSSPVRRFCRRLPPKALDLDMHTAESSIFQSFEVFRKAIHIAVSQSGVGRKTAGAFAVEILGKRLISSPVAFADSWWRMRLALDEAEAASDSDVVKAGKATLEDTDSDAETEAREGVASRVVGAWLRNLEDAVKAEASAIDLGLEELGLSGDSGVAITLLNPLRDSKIDETIKLIDRLIRDGADWRTDERLIIFTEFKTTLDYLLRRLRAHFGDDDRFLCLFGGMQDDQRRAIKNAFNDSEADVRVLVATDAASEGLNLQQTARYMLHFDCPWNPMRLEQRIGRLDRHGQGRDVEVFHFTSNQSADLRFLSRVIEKVDQVREDLGSCGEVFDAGVRRRLISGEDEEQVTLELNLHVDSARKLCHVEADDSSTPNSDPLSPLVAAIDLSPATMRDTLDTAMAWGGNGRPQLEKVTRTGSAPGTWKLRRENLPGWKDTIDHSVRTSTESRALGALRDLSFGPDAFLVPAGELKVFKNRPDTVFVHLANPLMKHGIQKLVRARYPGQETVSRWTVRRAPIPKDCDALILLNIEELGVNGLRETFHHWVRTVAFPVRAGKLDGVLPDIPAAELASAVEAHYPGDEDIAVDLILDQRSAIESWISEYQGKIQTTLNRQLEDDKNTAREEAQKGFQSRAGELSVLIQKLSSQRKMKEIEELKKNESSPFLFTDFNREIQNQIDDLENEVKREKLHLEEVRSVLDDERQRVMERVIPNRFTLGSDIAVFPVSLEVRFIGGGA